MKRFWRIQGVFDKVRHDPQAPNAYGARITYDLPIGQVDADIYQAIDEDLHPTPLPIAV